jgi:RimJ/RimL family protein N-acetyltransferase
VSLLSVRLEPLADRHLAGVAALVDDPEVRRFTRLPDPPPAGFAAMWIARYVAGRADGTSDGFAAIGDDGAFLGVALAPEIDRGGRQLELGYITAPAARGRGVASQILRELTAWAFAEGMLRSCLIIQVANPASRTVAERCGYTLEGVLRSLHLKDGIRVDCELWSRLAGD